MAPNPNQHGPGTSTPTRSPLRVLWRSPTFTTWGNFVAQTVSVVGVTWLVLARFDTLEIAAFYLFAATGSLATILADRVGLTFVRLYAFAVAGARDLRPIAAGGQARGEPDWQSLRQLRGSSGWIFLGCALLTAATCLAMGEYGLGNLESIQATVNSPPTAELPLRPALAVLAAGTFFSVFLRLHDAALKGFDEVALANRWAAVLGLLRGLAAMLTLLAGGRLLAVVVATQLALLVQGLVSRWLASRTLPRLAHQPLFAFEREVLAAAWQPTWRGLVAALSITGVSQLSGIVFTAYGEPAVVAGYLLALRLSTTLIQFTQAPFASRHPAFSRLRASGRLAELRRQVEGRSLLSLSLFAAGSLAVAVFAEPLLALLGARVTFIPVTVWLALSLLTLHDRFNVLALAICATGNRILYHWQQLLAGVLSLLALAWLIGPWGLWGIVLAIGVPRILMLLAAPPIAAARSLDTTTWGLARRAYLPALAGYVAVALVITLIEG